MTHRLPRRLAAASVFLVAALPPLSAQDAVTDAGRPVVTMRYVGLTNRQPFRLTTEGAGAVEKSVGDMAFEFPDGAAPTAGLQATPKSYCIDPLVPIYAGRTYNFAVDRVNDPQYYGLPDTAEGNAAAETRATYLRELYGRHYADTLGDDKVAVAAMQVALWEIAKETQVPEGPLPYNLYTGSFRAAYPDEAAAPEHVKRAQTYLQELTGNDTPFREAETLQGLELVRLTGMPGADGFVPQSQLMLRAAPSFAGGGGGGAPAGGYGGFGPSPGGGGGFGPALGGGFPLGGLGGGGSPVGPGGLGGGGFLPVGGLGSPNTDVSTGTENQPTTSSPQGPAVTVPPVTFPPEYVPPTEYPPVVTPPITVTPPPGGGEEVPPPGVPAPPAVILLALGGIGMVAYRRRRATLTA